MIRIRIAGSDQLARTEDSRQGLCPLPRVAQKLHMDRRDPAAIPEPLTPAGGPTLARGCQPAGEPQQRDQFSRERECGGGTKVSVAVVGDRESIGTSQTVRHLARTRISARTREPRGRRTTESSTSRRIANRPLPGSLVNRVAGNSQRTAAPEPRAASLRQRLCRPAADPPRR